MSYAEEQVNMSLDELIKVNKKKKEKKAPKSNNSTANATPASTPKAGAGKRRRRKSGSSTGSAAMEVDVKSASKVAAVVGAGKAKRAAQTNQRRGLNATGKASPAEIKAAVAKAKGKAFKSPVAAKGRKIGGVKIRPGTAGSSGKKQQQQTQRSGGGGKASGNTPKGLKISFKPAELPKTTEKDVMLQIKAALAKTSGNGNNVPNLKPGKSTAGRSVILTGARNQRK